MTESKAHEKDVVWMSGSYSVKGLMMRRAIVREGLSKLTETTIEFQSRNSAVSLDDLVGQTMNLHVVTEGGKEQKFSGLCISVENFGFRDGYTQFVAEVRPWFWLLTRTEDCRVFQNMTAPDIIKQILSEHGFSDYKDSLTGSYAQREYCLQYRESDYAFICRLMEEEGIYFFFDSNTSQSSAEKLIFADGLSAHKPISESATAEFYIRDDADRRRGEHVAELSKIERVTRGKVTLNDFDFTTPQADLKVSDAQAKGKHQYKNFEVYDYQAHYRKDTGLGTTLARARMDAEALTYQQWRGASSLRTLGAGYTFKLTKHDDSDSNKDFLVVEATHYLKVDSEFGERDRGARNKGDKEEMRRDLKAQNLDFPKEAEKDSYANTFRVIDKSVQYRAPRVTPWPEVPGIQTATVVGNSGEEILTDEHGRVKIQFHWDREGKDNETSSCFVRVMTPWSGKDWGMVAVPRIGQEVVVQFEDGNPDRPIVTGMLYNKETMPPYSYPDDQTQLGIKTNSSKGGGGYNELMFDDKKDSELMRIQAQKYHQTLVKDRLSMTVGLDAIEKEVASVDENSYDLTIEQHMNETVKSGDRTEIVETGNKVETVKTGDYTETIETGNKTMTIETGNLTENIDTGDVEVTIGQGSLTETISQGDHTETVSLGDITTEASAGSIAISAGMEITLTVGGSSIKIDNSGVTISGPMIKLEADGMLEAKSPLTTVKGDGMLTLKGGVTMIN
ncbi:type VI secretion system Vgr family protein [Phaeobacter sp. HF9A]|uniref:type VI secretion system Vgr family protein n=1 Tax=Phaeobacter sp. HF9A TaxID=2721561 RepID=UPI0014318024|nr:type VI secretion system tip protein TssI/VgrG [Phaeobacter sp. HF9A]NIZ15372.1 type VI secretion system tip protein VgrG [Phaeobacter sp. HF9A]